MVKILVFPEADKNPYQRLLYGAIVHDQPAEITYLQNTRNSLIFFPFVLLIKRLQGYKVFHLHWPSFYVSKTYPQSAVISFLLSKYCLYAIRFSGLKLVWTVHNVLPHEAETSNDLNIAKYLTKHAHAKILHSSFAMQELEDLGLDTSNTYVIPHGNYVGLYPNEISASAARTKLCIPKDDFVILFFGLIRTYKGIDDLLTAFAKLKTSKTKLVIAGKSDDVALTRSIKNASKILNVDVYPRFIHDAEVATYFKACDVVCLPFKAITTSGSAILAITFDKPIIAPLTGSLLDFPDDTGFFYDPQNMDSLQASLQRAIKNKTELESKIKGARAYAKTLEWDVIGRQTYQLYEAVLKTGTYG